MELKLSQSNREDSCYLLPKLLPQPAPPSHHRNWGNTKTSLKNQFRAIALRWSFQLQDMSKDHLSTEHRFVHIVERSYSLTSISNQNGVPVRSIVIANRRILNTDLEQKAQDIKIQKPRPHIRDIYQLQEKFQSSLNRLRNNKKLFALASPRLPPARTTSFIVLVPLIVFCVRCMIGASHARVFGTSRLETVNEPEGERHKFRSGHWRSALRDIRELDDLDSESSIDSTSPSEEEQISVEDLSHAYKKLDQDYEKFLSECGLSKWGYWRGSTQRPEQE